MPPSDENARCVRAKVNDRWDGPQETPSRSMGFSPPAVWPGAETSVAADIVSQVNYS
jgi:hypothetical protein